MDGERAITQAELSGAVERVAAQRRQRHRSARPPGLAGGTVAERTTAVPDNLDAVRRTTPSGRVPCGTAVDEALNEELRVWLRPRDGRVVAELVPYRPVEAPEPIRSVAGTPFGIRQEPRRRRRRPHRAPDRARSALPARARACEDGAGPPTTERTTADGRGIAMDGSRFDALARGMAGGASRRGVLGGLLGLGAGLAGLSAAEAAACPPDQIYRQRVGCVCRGTGRAPVGGVCPCPSGHERCGEVCVRPSSYQSDPANCGGCGAACGPNEYCRAGACIDRQGTCAAGADQCAQIESRPCNPDSPSVCACFPTVSGATFCGDFLGFVCQACDDDDDCVADFGPGAACVTLTPTDCGDCGLVSRRTCMAPCPPAP